MKKVLLDTNFLLLFVQQRMDVFSLVEEVLDDKTEFYIPDVCMDELKSLCSGKGKDAIAARVALQLLKRRNVKAIRVEKENCDDALMSVGMRKRMIVATNDKKLRKRLKDLGLKTIYLRSKKYLEVD